MGRTGCPETSITNYRATLRNVPEQKGLDYRAAEVSKSISDCICCKVPSDAADRRRKHLTRPSQVLKFSNDVNLSKNMRTNSIS